MALPKIKPDPLPAGANLSDSVASANAQLQSAVAQTSGWIVHNSLQIAIAAVAGTLITLALLGVRTLGMRLCREGPGGHWRTIVGRRFGRTSIGFCLIGAMRVWDG